ncbi:MAG: bifunctional 4-hydroxy-2-oxoglutarate aldolase/2-dehydro-3-deoxy-phosphogluconate aldolase, partial [Lachnospiraceae bacterium]|nr:bifunctional 4-hydroxy-2-oxoglutarate aldolase/2-dehydro-3-deoxy-phosphogluconate aldolase [Lachnospiraceae bacterium]
MNEILTRIGNIGIVPVVALDNAADAGDLGKALIDGGIPCAEVTFRTAAAEESIRILSEKYPQMLTGAGTVLTAQQADKAVAAGAKFIVSPGYNPKVVDHCVERGIPVVPGCATPSDIERAIEAGLDVVKFFPAEAAGGLPMIKAMSAPYGSVRFMPTGGINASNICSYLAFDRVIACGGSWMVDKKLIAAGNFEEITRLSKEAVDTILGFELA